MRPAVSVKVQLPLTCPVLVSGSPTVTGPAVGTPGSTVTVTVSVVVRTPLSAVMVRCRWWWCR